MPGSLTSRIKQLGPFSSLFLSHPVDKNSCAVPKDLECKPTDSISSWRDSRTSRSSSTMNTVGPSCVLIRRALIRRKIKTKKSRVASPIMRRLITPDKLYRMMQFGAAQSLGVEGGTRDD